MPEKILILDSDPTTITWLKAKLESQGFVVDTANLSGLALQKIASAPPDLLVLDFVLPDIDGIEVIRRVRNDPRCRNTRLIVLSALNKPETIAATMNAGADHYVVKRSGADVELVARIRALLARGKRSFPSGRGKVWTFCSAKGGSGTTSVCINTADALAKSNLKAMGIVLVDMVLPMGTVGTSLGIVSTQTVAKLSQESSIDPAVLERYVSHPTRWGFRVLLGANDPQEAGKLDVAKIQPIFETLRATYDYVLVDVGRTLSRVSLPIFEVSSDIIIVVTPDITTVKTTKFLIKYLAEHSIERERLVVVNNRTVGRVWTSLDDIERELGIPSKMTIPYLVEYMTMAINEAVPFVEKFPEDSGALVFADLARFLREYG